MSNGAEQSEYHARIALHGATVKIYTAHLRTLLGRTCDTLDMSHLSARVQLFGSSGALCETASPLQAIVLSAIWWSNGQCTRSRNKSSL